MKTSSESTWWQLLPVAFELFGSLEACANVWDTSDCRSYCFMCLFFVLIHKSLKYQPTSIHIFLLHSPRKMCVPLRRKCCLELAWKHGVKANIFIFWHTQHREKVNWYYGFTDIVFLRAVFASTLQSVLFQSLSWCSRENREVVRWYQFYFWSEFKSSLFNGKCVHEDK